MAYFIDGNNLIGSIKKEKVGKPEARYWILHYINKFQKKRRSKVILFFDGPKDYDLINISGNIEVVFSVEREADLLIKEKIKRIRYRKDLFVITADNEIISYARRKGAKIIKPRRFYNYMIRFIKKGDENIKPEENLTEDEIKLWENLFKKK